MIGSKVAVVTGESRGIRCAVAERLASDGVAVAVDAASSEAAHEIVTSVRLTGGSAVAVRADVADAGQVAVEGFTRVLAKELGSRAVTANAVAPGPVETELYLAGKRASDVAARGPGSAAPDRAASRHRKCRGPALSPDAGWISGQVIRVNGGVA